MSNSNHHQEENVRKIYDSLKNIESSLVKAGVNLDQVVEPVRQSVFKRYPLLFAMLVTLGGASTIVGLERLLLELSLFDEHPWLLFSMGVVILMATGSLYKKLG